MSSFYGTVYLAISICGIVLLKYLRKLEKNGFGNESLVALRRARDYLRLVASYLGSYVTFSKYLHR